MKLTAKQLESCGACRRQVVLFRYMFGESVDINPLLCVMVAYKFDFFWASVRLLKGRARDEAYRRRQDARTRGESHQEFVLINAESFGELYGERGV